MANAYLKRASAHLIAGQLEEAIADADAAMPLDPADARAYQIRSEAHAEAGPNGDWPEQTMRLRGDYGSLNRSPRSLVEPGTCALKPSASALWKNPRRPCACCSLGFENLATHGRDAERLANATRSQKLLIFP